MTPLYGHSALVAEFVAKLIPGCERGFGACTAIGVIDGDGKLVGGWVYHNWHPEAGVIEISGASINRRWLTRHVIRALFAYPFDDLKCQMIVTQTDEELAHVRRMWRAIGADEYMIPRLGGRDKSRALITLTDDAWQNSKFARKTDEQT